MIVENIIHLVFFAASTQGFILSAVFFRRTRNDDSVYKYLAWIFLIFSFILIHWIAFWRNLYPFPASNLGLILNTLDFLLAPLIFFFICSLSNSTFKIRSYLWLHFLPFILFFGVILSKIVLELLDTSIPYDYLSVAQAYNFWYMMIQMVQFIAYGIWIYVQLKKSSNQWIGLIGWLFILYFVSRIVYWVFALSNLITPYIDYAISVVICGSLLSIAFLNHLKPISIRERRAYEKSSLSDDHKSFIASKIVDHITNKKRYMDNDYSISKLSDEVSMSRHHISEALNQNLGKSFNLILNELRIEEAIRILKDPTRKNDKIIDVAYETGFNNKVSFNKYFKNKTGVSPLTFRKKYFSDRH